MRLPEVMEAWWTRDEDEGMTEYIRRYKYLFALGWDPGDDNWLCEENGAETFLRLMPSCCPLKGSIEGSDSKRVNMDFRLADRETKRRVKELRGDEHQFMTLRKSSREVTSL